MGLYLLSAVRSCGRPRERCDGAGLCLFCVEGGGKSGEFCRHGEDKAFAEVLLAG